MEKEEQPLVDGFVDAQEMHRMYPTTFEVPTEEELSSLKYNDFVKICNIRERFWIQIESINHATGDILGRIDNDLVVTSDYNLGDIVAIQKLHIYQIIDGDVDIGMLP